MPISEPDVRHVMSLARLSLPQEEVIALTRDLQAILGHVDTLKAVEAKAASSGVGEPLSQMLLRPDVCVEGLGAKGLEGSAGRDGTLVRVPRIME